MAPKPSEHQWCKVHKWTKQATEDSGSEKNNFHCLKCWMDYAEELENEITYADSTIQNLSDDWPGPGL